MEGIDNYSSVLNSVYGMVVVSAEDFFGFLLRHDCDVPMKEPYEFGGEDLVFWGGGCNVLVCKLVCCSLYISHSHVSVSMVSVAMYEPL